MNIKEIICVKSIHTICLCLFCFSVGELYFLATSYPSAMSPFGTLYKFVDPSRYVYFGTYCQLKQIHVQMKEISIYLSRQYSK